MKLQHNWNGDFRIVHPDGTTGAWSPYQSIAILNHQGKTYIAGSSYGLLPQPEMVYEITSHTTTTDSSMALIDRFGVNHINATGS